MYGTNVRRTRFFWIGKLDCREFWIRVLLLFHGSKWIEAETFEAFLDKDMADAMHRRVDESDVGRFVEISREFPVLYVS
jgi:hypothetical protein